MRISIVPDTLFGAATSASLLTSLACASAAPPPAVHPTPPASAPRPADASGPRPIVVRYAAGTRRYEIRTSATVVLQSDTGVGSSAALRSVAIYSVVIDSAANGLELHGQLDSLAMSGGGRVRQSPATPSHSMAFTGQLSPRGDIADLAASAPGDSVCGGALDPRIAPVRSLFPTLPDTLRPGMTWQDSVQVTTCRGTVPVQTSTVRHYQAGTPVSSANGEAIPVQVSAASHIFGQAAGGGDTITVMGDGTATAQTLVDIATGALLKSVAQSSAMVTVRSRHVTYPFRQEAADTIELLSTSR